LEVLLPNDEVFPEKSFSTDASPKLETDGHRLKLEPNINMDGGIVFCSFLYVCGPRESIAFPTPWENSTINLKNAFSGWSQSN
jgi:hypothetical protein